MASRETEMQDQGIVRDVERSVTNTEAGHVGTSMPEEALMNEMHRYVGVEEMTLQEQRTKVEQLTQ